MKAATKKAPKRREPIPDHVEYQRRYLRLMALLDATLEAGRHLGRLPLGDVAGREAGWLRESLTLLATDVMKEFR